MKKIVLLLFALVVAASCSQKYNAKVTFNVEGAADSTEIIVTKLSINRIYVVDTIYVKGEKTQFGANCQPGSPDFYYFLTDGNNNKMASVVLQEGDKLSVNVSKDGISTVEGSEEAVKYAEWERSQEEVLTKVYNLFNELDAAQQAKNDKKARELTTELTKLFVQHKQNSTKYLINNSKSISVIPVLYQKFSEALPVYGDINDVFIFKKVYDSLSVVYPNSPYVSSLADDIKQREQYIYFGTKIDNASEMSHPDISLYDVNAKVRNLSELDGKVIILSFWSTTEPTHKIFNAELKELYDKYKNRGLEVYQVCADTDKTAWASQVKAQGLEWVSVCDPGNMSGTLNLYNITNIPTLYIIDKKGDIVDKDVFDMSKLEKVISKLVR
jgi:peroxiredoxin